MNEKMRVIIDNQQNVMKILKGIDDIAINIFTEKDVVRHRLVQDIIKAYERQDARKNK